MGRNGGKNPRGRRFLPRDPLLWWGCVGGGCTSYGIPGLRPSQRKARNGPPTGWAGWGRGQVSFGKRQKVTVWFPTFSSRQQTTSPARPSWWAGHEALVLEAAGQVGRQKTHAASTTVQRKGVWGKETLSPTGSRGTAPGALSPISPEKWGPAREGQVPAVPTAPGDPTSPPPGRQPLPSISTVPGQTAPDRQTAGFPLGKPAVTFCHGISAQALARNFSSRSSPSLMFSMDTAKDHRT